MRAPARNFLTDHLLSLMVFGGAVAEFLLWPRFGSSTYFLLALLALVDFMSGIALRARRGKQLASAAPQGARRPVSVPPEVKSEPKFVDPPATSPVPAAALLAESVPLDHPQPQTGHPDAAAASPSPEVPSPELQPDNSLPRSPDAPPR